LWTVPLAYHQVYIPVIFFFVTKQLKLSLACVELFLYPLYSYSYTVEQMLFPNRCSTVSYQLAWKYLQCQLLGHKSLYSSTVTSLCYSRSHQSHSAAGSMNVIDQVAPVKTTSSRSKGPGSYYDR